MKFFQFSILILSLSFLWTTPSYAQNPEWPSSWQGIWDFDHQVVDCDGSFLVAWTEPDTICTGTPILDSGQDCSGTTTDTSIHVVCSQQEIRLDCVWTVETEMYATKTDDTIQGTIQTTYSSSWELCENFCRQDHISANFVSANSGPCSSVPIAEGSWGTLKAKY
jgi:hypothetical protein